MRHLEHLAVVSLAVLAPTKAAVVTVLVLCLSDLLLGVVAAIKTKEPVTSAGLKRTVLKFFVYEIALISAFLTQAYLLGPELPAMSIVSGLIGLTELKSILENLDLILGESLFKMILKKLESKPDEPNNTPAPPFG